MADPFVAEIRIFGFNFAPKGWAFCNGQLMPISQNTAVFALVGTMYGGDGKSTFALPDLQGAVPIHWEQGPGLSDYGSPGASGGSDTITLLTSEMPVHSHVARGSADDDDSTLPAGNSYGGLSVAYAPGNSSLQPMAAQTITPAGSSLPHNNLMPYLTLNYCIALQGVFPPRP